VRRKLAIVSSSSSCSSFNDSTSAINDNNAISDYLKRSHLSTKSNLLGQNLQICFINESINDDLLDNESLNDYSNHFDNNTSAANDDTNDDSNDEIEVDVDVDNKKKNEFKTINNKSLMKTNFSYYDPKVDSDLLAYHSKIQVKDYF
jgi:hypothetical protein